MELRWRNRGKVDEAAHPRDLRIGSKRPTRPCLQDRPSNLGSTTPPTTSLTCFGLSTAGESTKPRKVHSPYERVMVEPSTFSADTRHTRNPFFDTFYITSVRLRRYRGQPHVWPAGPIEVSSKEVFTLTSCPLSLSLSGLQSFEHGYSACTRCSEI